jgi:Omp85 superfamily domain/WD40-like Beta Propeller Repeat
MSRAIVLLASALLLLPLTAAASDRYDPRLRFQTISTTRFDIHYHQGEEAEARRLAAIAETVAAELDTTLGPPSGRVQVILVDQSDLSNGWATPLPFNTMEITAAAPGGTSPIGNTTDWLRLVFTHEYAHIVHLSRGRSWIGGLRRVFGRMPLLYPNLFLPSWQIEGIATYEESAITGQGRVRDGSFRAILDVAASQGTFEPLDRASGGLVDWPAGHAPYLYGGNFHQFLRDRHGEESLRRLTDATAGRIPYFGSPAFKDVFGRSLDDLWKEFEAASKREAPAFGWAVTRLTTHGFDVHGPRFGDNGRIYYSAVNPHGFPSLLALDPTVGASPRMVTDRFLGNRIGVAGSTLVFDQVDVHNHVGLQSDLYSIASDGTGRRRLTDGARAADPDVSPDGQTIACTVQRADRRELATLRLRNDGRLGVPETLISESRVSFAAPRWSPDGRWILAERGTREIVLIDPQSKRVIRTIAASPQGRALSARWMADGTVLFASDREGAGFRLYRSNTTTLETWRLEGTGPDARTPEVSPDGRTLVFVGYTAQGYDLFSMPLASAVWTVAEPGAFHAETRAILAEAGDTMAAALVASPYSPWRTLAPRFWTPTIESDGDEVVFGAATGSLDALGRHAYGIEAGWATSRARPDWQVAYAYDRWWPTLFANVADDTDPWRDGDLRTREANAGVLLPFRRVRWTQSLLGALHASADRLRCTGCPDDDIVRRAVRGGWRVNAARSYGYSVSLEDGWSAAATTELAREAFGSDGDAGAATIDIRGYVPVVPRHGVLAVRAAGASTWGDAGARRVFSASGHGPQPGGFRFGSDAIGLLRGVDDDDLIGLHAAVVNLEYRFPVVRLDRGAGTWPVFARVVHGALFVDAGNAWNTTFRGADVLVSAGAEISLDAVVGYGLPITFTTGAAWVSGGGGLAVFGRIGRAF